MAANGFLHRKRLFISSFIQGKIMTRVAIYWVVYHLVMWHTLFIFDYFQYRVTTINGTPAAPFVVLYQNFCLKYYPLIFSALACTPLLLADTLRITHRIAGPLYRFKTALEAVLNGERVDSVQLRDYDLLVEFQDTFNRFLKSYNEHKYGPQAASAEAIDNADDTEMQVLENVDQLRSAAQQMPKTPTEAVRSSPLTRSSG